MSSGPDPGQMPPSADPGKQGRAAAGIPVLPALDGFRVLAIFGVVGLHVLLFSGAAVRIDGTLLGDLSILLPLGVDILFIVSGFVLFLPVVVRGGEFGPIGFYGLRRAARIVPALWLVLVLIVVLIALAPPPALVFTEGGADAPVPSAGEIAAHLAMFQNAVWFFDADFKWGLFLGAPLWTLSLELIFYGLLPLIAGAYYRRPLIGLGVAAAITLAWQIGFGNLFGITDALGIEIDREELGHLMFSSGYQFPAYAFAFAAGMSAAWAYVTLAGHGADRGTARGSEWLGRLPVIQIASLAACIGFALWLGSQEGLGAPAQAREMPLASMGFTASISILILATVLRPSGRQGPIAGPGAVALADVSYGVYLIHYVVLAYALLIFSPVNDGGLGAFVLWSAIAVTASLAWGWASARLLEQPIRRRAERFGRRRSARKTADR